MTAPTAPEDQRSPSLAWLAAYLVMDHQAEQQSIAAALVKKLGPLWKILDPRNLKGTRTPWLATVLPEVRTAYEQSQRAAQRFAIDYRHAHLPAAEEIPGLSPESAHPAPVVTDTAFESTRAAVSLASTGPGEVAHRIPSEVTVDVSAPEVQALETRAMRAAQALSSRVAVRIAIDGGRNVVQRAVELDQEALGYARVLNINPCYFCAILASRGAVYKLNSFTASNAKFNGEGVAKAHDGCRCGLRPVYSTVDGLDPTAMQVLKQWTDYTTGLTGKEAINTFRRYYTPPAPPEVPRIDLHSLLVARDDLVAQGFAETSTQVAWMDRQIARFSAILDANDVPAGMTAPRGRRPSGAARRRIPTSRQQADALHSGVTG